MDFIPLNCPLKHFSPAVQSPQIGEIEAGIAVSVRLKCPHKHHGDSTGRIQFTVDRYGNVTWKELSSSDKVYHDERPVRISYATV